MPIVHLAKDFNPRALTGRDVAWSDGWFYDVISIHAPSRGATSYYTDMVYMFAISIHAPSRGATLNCVMSSGTLLFQSTRPHGARHHEIYSVV